jgi:hypothetical protein
VRCCISKVQCEALYFIHIYMYVHTYMWMGGCMYVLCASPHGAPQRETASSRRLHSIRPIPPPRPCPPYIVRPATAKAFLPLPDVSRALAWKCIYKCMSISTSIHTCPYSRLPWLIMHIRRTRKEVASGVVGNEGTPRDNFGVTGQTPLPRQSKGQGRATPTHERARGRAMQTAT